MNKETNQVREPFDPEKAGILKSCEVLHMHCNGSAIDLTDAEITAVAEFLRRKLRKWKPTILDKDREYDNAARKLVVAALVGYVLDAGSLE